MLFHLFSPSASSYVTFPSASGGPYSVSTKPGPGTVIDLCGPRGVTISRGLFYAPSGPGFVTTRGDVHGYDSLNNDDTVTMRHPSQRYITPRGSSVTLESVTWAQAQFKIRKVGGSSGSSIRHGDTIALGAKQPFDPRRRPDQQQYRWLQADPEDNDPATNPVVLGGLSLNPGGPSQRFTFLEGNLLEGDADLTVSDRVPPGEMLSAGSLRLRLSHEGLPNGSTARLRFTAIAADTFSFNSSGPTIFDAAAPIRAINVPPGVRELSFPLSLFSMTLGDPCTRFARLLTNTIVAPGAFSVVDEGMEDWSGSAHDGGTARAVGITSRRALDWLQISLSGSVGDASQDTDGYVLVGGADDTFTVTVRSAKGVGLPPIPGPLPRIVGSGYTISVVAMPFPFPGFATDANTRPPQRISGDSPILVLNREGGFLHRTRFRATPRGLPDMFCIQVNIQPYRNTPNALRLSRRMALRVF